MDKVHWLRFFGSCNSYSFYLSQISLWTSNASDEVAVRRIGRQFKEILQLGPTTKIVYQAHADALDSNKSYYNKSRYELWQVHWFKMKERDFCNLKRNIDLFYIMIGLSRSS